jgi:hypothetical protein
VPWRRPTRAAAYGPSPAAGDDMVPPCSPPNCRFSTYQPAK